MQAVIDTMFVNKKNRNFVGNPVVNWFIWMHYLQTL